MERSKQEKIDRLYLRMAFIWAENSYAIRRHVGCLIVKDGSIISDGYNGTPSGFPNICEYAVSPNEGSEYCKAESIEELKKLQDQGWRLITYPIVLHAESNAIAKLAKSNNSSKGETIYITDEPCLNCAKNIIQAGITRVVYSRSYHLHEGIELLKQVNIEIQQITIENEKG